VWTTLAWPPSAEYSNRPGPIAPSDAVSQPLGSVALMWRWPAQHLLLLLLYVARGATNNVQRGVVKHTILSLALPEGFKTCPSIPVVIITEKPHRVFQAQLLLRHTTPHTGRRTRGEHLLVPRNGRMLLRRQLRTRHGCHRHLRLPALDHLPPHFGSPSLRLRLRRSQL
jgi:hypothetical protein